MITWFKRHSFIAVLQKEISNWYVFVLFMNFLNTDTFYLVRWCFYGKWIFNYFFFFNDTECWQRLINECLPYESSKVRLAATDALAALSEQYYVSDEEKRNSFMQQLDVYFKQAASNTECSRLGYALALGKMFPFIYLLFDFYRIY